MWWSRVSLSCCVFFFKQKTAYEMRISDWSSDVCSSDLRGPPVVERLTRTAVDQVEVERLETRGTSELDGALDVGAVVGATQRREHVRRRGLHAERQQGDAPRPVGADELLADGVGVALDGDLAARGAWHPVEHRHQIAGRHHRRRAAAHEDRRSEEHTSEI